MSIFSAIFGGGKKYKEKREQERMQNAARGQSVLGNIFGSSPYIQEWRRQNKDLNQKYKYDNISLRKQWAWEDIAISRDREKERQRYNRKYKNPEDAAKWFGKWDTEKRRELERDHKHQREDMEYKKKADQRNIGSQIKKFG